MLSMSFSKNNKIRVAILSAGAGPAVSIIKELIRQRILPIKIFAYASDISSAGLYLADEKKVIPKISDKSYMETVIQILNEDRIDFVIPILDAEVKIFANNIQIIKKMCKSTFFINNSDSVNLALDKYNSYVFNLSNSILTPCHYFYNEIIQKKLNYKILMKPRSGVGSKGQAIFSKSEDITKEFDNDSNLFCEYIDGVEYSIDAINIDNDYIVVPRIRSEIRNGQMVKGETFYDPQLILLAKDILNKYKINDVACLQVIKRKDRYYFIELNPRYGTGISLSINSGPNFPLLQIYKALRIKIPNYMTKYKSGLKVSRYWEEVYYE